MDLLEEFETVEEDFRGGIDSDINIGESSGDERLDDDDSLSVIEVSLKETIINYHLGFKKPSEALI